VSRGRPGKDKGKDKAGVPAKAAGVEAVHEARAGGTTGVVAIATATAVRAHRRSSWKS